MKLAIVIQRYGTEITGGSEHLCRLTAERLARRGYDIDVLTSCARDYISWKNEYTAGRSVLNGVTVYRFPTVKTRDLDSFNKFSEQIYYNYHTTDDETKWLEDQGPLCPALIDFLKSMHRSYDRILFYTYLYYPTVLGLQVAPEKSVLVPTAHDEPAIKLGIFRDVFTKPAGLIYNTDAEKDLVASLFSPRQAQQVAGIGVEIPHQVDKHAFRRQQGLMENYFYYGGRIDAGKGCHEMLDFYMRKKRQDPETPKLMLSGHLNMELPGDPSVVYLGYLPEEEKQAALQGATCTIIPSVMESLSIVLLESFAARTPAIVKEGSAVLKAHCVKSNAGLYYNDYEEFSACLDYLMQHPRTSHQMGINGQRYVQNNYSWPRVISIYEAALQQNAVY